jgi:hypothetical protein
MSIEDSSLPQSVPQLRRSTARGGRIIADPGYKFGRWTLIREDGFTVTGQQKWWCKCDCGIEKSNILANLMHGFSRGCKKCSRHPDHEMPRNVEYATWRNIHKRCEQPSASQYHNYGGRGIRVCERWESFENFLAYMGPKPTPMHSIDRIDVNGNYEPENCRWATDKEQGRNLRKTVYLTVDGVRRPLVEWAEIIGIRKRTLHGRLKRGWSDDEIVHGKPAIPVAEKNHKTNPDGSGVSTTCLHCGSFFTQRPGIGRPRKFCAAMCAQAYKRRRTQ